MTGDALYFVLYCAAVKAKNVVTLDIDGVMAQPGIGVEGVSHTNTQDPLYIGGLPGNYSSNYSLCASSSSCVKMGFLCRVAYLASLRCAAVFPAVPASLTEPLT